MARVYLIQSCIKADSISQYERESNSAMQDSNPSGPTTVIVLEDFEGHSSASSVINVSS